MKKDKYKIELARMSADIVEVRGEAYGHPAEDFQRIGRMWGAILGVPDVTPLQVALMMDAVKTSRLCATPDHEDSLLDKHGYTNCYEIIMTSEINDR